MFENIDANTIQIANNCIKETYEKFQDYNITSHIKKEEILERDFNNLFIFEDFFSEYLMENRDNNAREELIEDMVDLIDVNQGDITIEELYRILCMEEETEDNDEEEKEIEVEDYGLLNMKFDANANVNFGDNHAIALSELADDSAKALKKIDNIEKADKVKANLRIKINKPSKKSKFNEENSLGSEIKKWSLYKNQETKNKKRK